MSRMKQLATLRFIIVLLAMCASVPVFPQGVNVEFDKSNFKRDDWPRLKEVVREMEKGDELFVIDRRAAYLQALEFFMPANNFNPNNALLNYKIGKCLLFSLQKTNAIFYLEKAERLDPQINRELDYLKAQAYHFNPENQKTI